MKISYLLGSVGLTGGNVVLFHHMEALASDGHEVKMVTPFGQRDWREGTLAELQKASHIPGYDGFWSKAKEWQRVLRKSFPSVEKQVISMLRGGAQRQSDRITRGLIARWVKSDITIATHCLTARAAASLTNVSRCFYHLQGFEPWFSDEADFKAIAESSYKLPLRKFANCTWLRDTISELSNHEVGLVRPGLNHNVFRPVAKGHTHDPQHRSGEKKSLKIVSYADHRPLKGWAESQAAMKLVFERVRGQFDLEWIVFGSISEGDIGVPVTYRGFLSHEDLAMLYREADFIFVPSWFESFPLQPIEAMACGAAVITTRIGTEDYARDYDTALVVTAKDPGALADAILKLIEDAKLREEISRNGTLEAGRFNWEESARELRVALDLL